MGAAARLAVCLALLCSVACFAMADPIKVACVGDSITAGVGADSPSESWPAVLGRMLGANYDVRNFGVSGTTMLKFGGSQYWQTTQFQSAQSYAPNIVIIMLGTNDTKPGYWDAHQSEFTDDAKAMLTTFKELPSNPRVILAIPIPVFGTGNYGISKQVMDNDVAPALRSIAAQTNTELMDMYPVMAPHADQIGDNVHPTAAGYRTMARYIFAYLTHGPTIIVPTDQFILSATVSIVPASGSDETLYTTDGSDPGTGSAKYSGPFEITKTSVVKARAVTGGKLSDWISSYAIVRQTPLPAVNVDGLQPGLALDMFVATDDQLSNHFDTLTNPVSSIEPQIDLPAGAPAQHFGLLFNGYIKVPADDIYTFATRSDDGSRLYVDNRLVVDNWGMHGNDSQSGDVALAAGSHSLRVEYFQAGGGDALAAFFGPASEPLPSQEIPGAALFHKQN